MAGLFFCLASAEGAGLLFFPATIQPNTSVYNGFSAINAIYTTHITKQRTGLYRRFSGYLTHFAAHDARPTQAAIIPPAPRWSVSQHRNTSSTYQIPPPRRTLYRPAQPPYYNKVYKGAAVRTLVMDPCQTVQHIADHDSLAGSAPIVCGSLVSATPGAPAEWSARRAARNHWRLPPYLFSGFRPIANRGQQ